MNKNVKQFDKYMKDKSQIFMFGRYRINPSSDFTDRVLNQVEKIENQRRFILNAITIILVFTPFIFRELWSFARHDYFSVSRMPYGQMILGTYTFFLSNLATYMLLGIGIIGAGVYLFGNRLSSKIRILTNRIFSQARFRV